MRVFRCTCNLALVLLFSIVSHAQPATSKGLGEPLATHLLNSLTDDQKIKLQALLSNHYADNDGDILELFKSLNETEQKRINALLQFLRNEEFAPMTKTIWSKESSTFYDVPYGSVAIDSFQVTNVGTQPYKITIGKTSCECITLKYSNMPLMPLESMMVQIEYDPARMARVNYDYVIAIEDNSEADRRKLLKLSTVFNKTPTSKKKPPKP